MGEKKKTLLEGFLGTLRAGTRCAIHNPFPLSGGRRKLPKKVIDSLMDSKKVRNVKEIAQK